MSERPELSAIVRSHPISCSVLINQMVISYLHAVVVVELVVFEVVLEVVDVVVGPILQDKEFLFRFLG